MEPNRDAFVTTWLPIVLRWCACLGGPRVDPEDAAHDVLIVALDRLPTLREADRVASWMFGITRRVLARHRRAAWVRRWLPGVVADAVDPSPSPLHRHEADDVVAGVQGVIDALPEELREVLVLGDVEERSDEAVAALLGIPVGTAKSRLRRARARFEQVAKQTGVTAVLLLEGA